MQMIRIRGMMEASKEQELSDLRHRLFESNMTTSDYKSMLYDTVSLRPFPFAERKGRGTVGLRLAVHDENEFM